MDIDYSTIITTLINFTLLVISIIIIYKFVQGSKNFINKNKNMDKKIDVILNKLDNKEDK